MKNSSPQIDVSFGRCDFSPVSIDAGCVNFPVLDSRFGTFPLQINSHLLWHIDTFLSEKQASQNTVTFRDQTTMSREPAKRAREDGIIKEFLEWFNRDQSTDYELISRPDPPDAILRSSGGMLWVEHADILRNEEEAHELFSMMNPAEPSYRHQGLAINGYDGLPDAFISILHSKLNKASYDGARNEHGPGILLLTEMDPLFDE